MAVVVYPEDVNLAESLVLRGLIFGPWIVLLYIYVKGRSRK